jgi:hypothetical protein
MPLVRFGEPKPLQENLLAFSSVLAHKVVVKKQLRKHMCLLLLQFINLTDLGKVQTVKKLPKPSERQSAYTREIHLSTSALW